MPAANTQVVDRVLQGLKSYGDIPLLAESSSHQEYVEPWLWISLLELTFHCVLQPSKQPAVEDADQVGERAH